MKVSLNNPDAIGVKHPLPGVVYLPPEDMTGYLAAGVLTRETLVDRLKSICRLYPDNIALQGIDFAISYRELDEISTRLAAALLNLGLEQHDRVMFQLGDSEQLIYCFIACLKAGLIPVCTLAAHREHEIGYLANLAEAKLHIVQGDNSKFDDVAFAEKMQTLSPSLTHILQARGTQRGTAVLLHELIADLSLAAANKRLEAVELDPFQVAVFQLSGGTTGVPKIIPRHHNEYLYNMLAVADWLGYRESDTLFMPQPMVHNLNMGCCFGPTLMVGGTVTIMPDLQPESLISMIKKTSPSWLMLGGPIIARLESAIHSGDIDLSNARGILVANGAKKLSELFGAPAYTVFGMTEGVIMFTHPTDPSEVLDTTNGRPVSEYDQVKIVEPGTNTPVKKGEIGEPLFKGPYTIRGYYNAEERNKEAFTEDGFYRPGDLMQQVEINGVANYIFLGRLKDLVNRGGEKINCEEVENAVSGHPAVAAVMVVPYPDPVMGERLCVVLILRDDHSAPSIKELGKYLKNYGMAKYKWPERIEVVNSFPLSASGKQDRKAVRELVEQRLLAEHNSAAALTEESRHDR